jgi:hypothetical protein
MNIFETLFSTGPKNGVAYKNTGEKGRSPEIFVAKRQHRQLRGVALTS